MKILQTEGVFKAKQPDIKQSLTITKLFVIDKCILL